MRRPVGADGREYVSRNVRFRAPSAVDRTVVGWLVMAWVLKTSERRRLRLDEHVRFGAWSHGPFGRCSVTLKWPRIGTNEIHSSDKDHH